MKIANSGRGDSVISTLPQTRWEFAERFSSHPVSIAWRVVNKAIEGVPLDAQELAVFAELAGHAEPSPTGYEEVLVLGGRGSGKSEEIALDAVFVGLVEAPRHFAALPAGSQLTYLVLAGYQKQATISIKAAASLFARHKELGAMLADKPLINRDGGVIRLATGVTICTAAWSKSGARGERLVGVALDETAWSPTSEQSAHQDVEVVAAVRGGLIAPDGAPPRRLIAATSAGGRAGWVYETHEQFFGKPHLSVLVVRGSSKLFNPTLSDKQLARAQARDPIRFLREYGYLFSDTVAKWVDAVFVDASPIGRDGTPLPPKEGVQYVGSIDAAFKRDAFAQAIAHLEKTPDGEPRLVVDLVERIVPRPGVPLDSMATVAHCAATFHAYGITEIYGDQFSSIPLAGEFKRHGITLTEVTATSRSKLEHYTKLREMFFARRVSLPRHEVLLREFRDLQESITGGGNVRIDHPVGGSSDCASAVAWAVAAIEMQPKGMAAWYSQLGDSEAFGAELSAAGSFWRRW